MSHSHGYLFYKNCIKNAKKKWKLIGFSFRCLENDKLGVAQNTWRATEPTVQ